MPHSISLGRITVGAHDPSPTNSRTRAESETRVGTRAGTQQHMNSTNSVSFDHQYTLTPNLVGRGRGRTVRCSQRFPRNFWEETGGWKDAWIQGNKAKTDKE
eukprot:836791-Amorphochlora_amoeboformis.AAC.1